MTSRQKIALRLSEVRSRLNEISGLEGDAFSDEIRTESGALQTEYADLETRHRAAIVAESAEPDPDPNAEPVDPETRERLELRGKARVGDFVSAALSGTGVKGASAEYADAVGVAGRMPLELLEAQDAPEERAVTPGPSSETVSATRPTVPFAFSRTDSAALGIAMPMVAPGEAHFPALTTAPPAGPKAKDAVAESTAAAFTLAKRTPGRITGSFVVRLEDIALMPSMEADLRMAIAGAMADNLDAQVISGSGAAPNLSGLFHQADDVAIAGAAESFNSGISRFAGLVDGKYAHGWGDIRALIGTKTFELYAGSFQNSNKGDISLYDYLMGKLGGLRVSTRVPDVAATGQKGIALLSAQGQPVTVPIWSGVEIIVDPYTLVGKGQRSVTAVTLVGSPFIPHGVAQVKEVHPKLS